MRKTDEPQLARRAGDHERALDIVEQAHAFRVERVRAHEVFSGQQRQLGKRQREREAVGRQRAAASRRPCRSATPYTGVPSARTMPTSTDRGAAVGREHFAATVSVAPCAIDSPGSIASEVIA